MKKVLSIVLALALLCVTFAACAGNGTSSTSSASEESSAVSSESSAEASESSASSEESTSTEKTKIGILAPAVTHGWVAGVAYYAEQRCKELSDTVDYKLYTSNNAEEMTSQIDDLKSWGAEAIVAFPQWEGMEVPIQEAIDEGIVVVNFDIEIAAAFTVYPAITNPWALKALSTLSIKSAPPAKSSFSTFRPPVPLQSSARRASSTP